MTRHTAFVLVLGLAASPVLAESIRADAAAVHQKSGERRIKWWVDEQSRAELGITDQQSADIEQIFQGTLPKLRQVRDELNDLETKLSKMIANNTAPVAVVSEQVDRVESARAEMNKLRTVMLYRIDRVLSAEQRAKLKAWHERRRAARSGGNPERR